MDKDIFSPAILGNETEPLIGFINLYGPNAFQDLPVTCEGVGRRRAAELPAATVPSST